MLKTELVLFVVATFVVNFSSALYFHISETERKCFIEEIPDDTTVLGMYRQPIERIGMGPVNGIKLQNSHFFD